MLPGKKYVPEDFVRILWTRKWFIIVPVVLIGGATAIYSHFLPDQYRASTTILVIPQSVPENFVRPTVTADVGERLQSISHLILNRTRLEQIIEEFNLYPEERKTRIMEDIVERMRSNHIKLDVTAPRGRGQDASSFTVSFISEQPRTAMLVAERIASLFVTENLQDRENLADQTHAFLQSKLEDARRRLIDHEKKLEEFRKANMGRLPTQAASNLQMVQTTQSQLQANADAQTRDANRLLVLEGAVAELTAEPTAAPVETVAVAEGTPELPVAQQLEAARAGLRGLELRLKEGHPDIRTARRLVAELQAKADAEALNAPVAPRAAPVVAARTMSPATAARVTNMRTEITEIRARMESRKQEEARLQKQLAGYAARLEATPTLESELTELMRDYSTVQEQYTALLKKSEESRIAVDLERRQIGERFSVVEGARLPERPFSPDRNRINVMGLAAGLGLGLALVVLLEYRDTTLKTDVDVVASLSLPVLAVIPAMMTAGERRRLQRRRLLMAAAAVTAILLAAAGVIAWKLRLVQDWIG